MVAKAGFTGRVLQKLRRLRFVDEVNLATAQEVAHLKTFFSEAGVDIVFDVGANLGQYARLLMRNVGYKGPIISVEPIPEIAVALRRSAAKHSNWYVEEVLLSERTQKYSFNVMKDRQCSSIHERSTAETSLFSAQTEVERVITVQGETLEELYARWSRKLKFRRPFLKLDTQGHDVAVVRGGAKVMDRFVGLQSELSLKQLYQGGPQFQEALAFYRQLGFEVSAVVSNNSKSFPLLIEVDVIMVRLSAFGGDP